VVIKGKGIDKTVLSFKGQKQVAEGIRIDNCKDITIEDLTVEDTAGDNIKVQDTDGITFRRVKSAWTGKIGTENGAYGLYLVICKNVLIEECEVLGSSEIA
jgi:polygalacturonase